MADRHDDEAEGIVERFFGVGYPASEVRRRNLVATIAAALRATDTARLESAYIAGRREAQAEYGDERLAGGDREEAMADAYVTREGGR